MLLCCLKLLLAPILLPITVGVYHLSTMDTLSELGVNINAPGNVVEQQLNRLPNPTLCQIHSSLFCQTQGCHLANPRDVLVGRRDTSVKPAKEKYAADVWELVNCIRNNIPVKRTLVSGGKRSATYLYRTEKNSLS